MPKDPDTVLTYVPKEKAVVGIEDKYDQVMDLITLGKQKGYLLYDEINELLPSDLSSSDEIEDILATFGTAGIEAIEERPKFQPRDNIETFLRSRTFVPKSIHGSPLPLGASLTSQTREPRIRLPSARTARMVLICPADKSPKNFGIHRTRSVSIRSLRPRQKAGKSASCPKRVFTRAIAKSPSPPPAE